MGGQDQQLADAQPALGRQPPEPVDPVVAELVVGPFGRRADRLRHAVHHRRERRRVVEVGHRDVGVAGDDQGAVGLELADRVDDAGRVGAVEDQVAADHHGVRPLLLDRRPDRLERHEVAVDVAEDRDPGHQRSTAASGMMKLSVAWQATSPSTVAVPRPRPKRRPSLSMVTSRRSVSPGLTIRLKRHSSMPAEQPDPVAEAGLLGHEDGHRLGQGLDLQHPGHDRQAREVALEEPLRRGHRLEPDDPPGRLVVLDDPIDEQERPAMRDQALDLAGRVDDGRRGVGHGQLHGAGWRKCAARARGRAAEFRAGLQGV